MRNNNPKTGKGLDEEKSPASGVTPVAQVSTVESLKDVVPAPKSGVAGTLGYTYYEYEYLRPIEYMPQVLVRTLRFNPYGYHRPYGGSDDPVLVTNWDKVTQFWSDVPQLMLDKVLRRDGIRFLPDSFDNANILEYRELLFAATRAQLKTIRTLIDSTSWNEGTQFFLRDAFARKNRRCMEAENNLATIEISPLWTSLGDSEPVISSQPGGPILITLVDFSNIVAGLGTNDATHPAFLNKGIVSPYTLIDSSADVDKLLQECENAIKLLRFRDDTTALDGTSNAGFTWTAGSGRGVQSDFKYLSILLSELRYPASGPISGEINVSLGMMNQRLYGEAIYGTDLETGTPDVRHFVGYPYIETGDKAVLRRGYVPMDPLLESGFGEVWAVESTSFGVTVAHGFKAEFGLANSQDHLTKFAVNVMDRYGDWTVPDGEVNLDSATELRDWLVKSTSSDHQWKEGILNRVIATDNVVKSEQPAVYSFHQSILVPYEGMRAALCTAYNVPFLR